MIDRRTFLALMAAAGMPAQLAAQAAQPFSRDWLINLAREKSQTDYIARPLIPEPWRTMDYDDFQHIWFNAKKAIWNDTDSPVKIDLFTAGLYVERATTIHLVTDGQARVLPYDISLFDKTDDFPDLPIDDTMGYSGLRLRAELNQPEIFEEFMVFQGASYFRAIANKQTYGLSARGLALRTGDPAGEEFPDFTDFWVEAPRADADSYIVHALLDGPSVTGAFQFTITPGAPTTVTVQSTLFPRVDLMHVGLGTLTSMFLFDETNRNRFDDFRPAVHDSEGLLIVNGNGERIWRPLANHKTVEVSAFIDDSPAGFGLMQRDRDPESYADLEAHYDARPSLWITPDTNWGAGAVELVEIPADREIYDNIVAYWRPREPLQAGQRYDIGYRMDWGDEPAGLPDVARVINTRIGKGFDQIKTVFAIDFAPHPALEGPLDDLTIILRGTAGEVSPPILQQNPGTGGLRLNFSVLPGDAPLIELRAQMLLNGNALTEVWLYRWTV
ncbi:glucan biosynthesis protein [Yoonia sediminilitoris]|uniref:glucan biosynthesis protein n=1 Tax=Yoonia sediminilitoris TaxID=1286148 RepID=UPI001FEB1F5D|nr:glucan biosynthesis protein G [Yoonia sediminilitoris]